VSWLLLASGVEDRWADGAGGHGKRARQGHIAPAFNDQGRQAAEDEAETRLDLTRLKAIGLDETAAKRSIGNFVYGP
jgi:hypothetical protein